MKSKFQTNLQEITRLSNTLKEVYNLGLMQIPSGKCDAEVIYNQIKIKVKDHLTLTTLFLDQPAKGLKKYENSFKIKGTIIQYCIKYANNLAEGKKREIVKFFSILL